MRNVRSLNAEFTRDGSSSNKSARVVMIGFIALSVFSAGCFRRSAAPPAEPPIGAADSLAMADSTPLDSATLDSIAQAARAAALADSIRRDSVTADSIVRAAADSARPDSVLRAADSVPKPKAPAAKPPARDCLLDFNESPPESRLWYSRVGENSQNLFIGGGVVARCQGDPQTIRADSAEQYESAGLLNLIGGVVFDEPGKIRMTSQSMSYFADEDKLVAYQNVVATDIETGSTFSGPIIEYYRATVNRPASRMYAPQRPTLRLIEKDSLGRALPPVTIIANQFEAIGDTGIVAWGTVQINREGIRAEADSASFDKLNENSRLIRNASIVSLDTAQPFRLVGDSIDLFSTDRVIERVVALHRAQATSNDVTMRAERVEMKLEDQQVREAWASGAGRSYAQTTLQELEADSLEILMPGQILTRVNAVGRALAKGTPDTVRIADPEEDVLSGDTIVAEFDTATTAPDTAAKSIIRRVTAILNASALYQIPSSRGRSCPPAINYSRGHKVVVDFDSGSIQDVTIDSAASGVYLEPTTDSLVDTTVVGCVLPDSAARDSMARDSVRRDSVRRDSVARDSVVTRPPDTLTQRSLRFSEPAAPSPGGPAVPARGAVGLPTLSLDRSPHRRWRT